MDGASQYAIVPPGLWASNAFTIETWIQLRAASPLPSVLFEFGAGAGGDCLRGQLDPGSRPALAFSGSVSETVASVLPLALNTWTHLAFSFAPYPGNSSGHASIYINGMRAGGADIPAPSTVPRILNFIGRSANPALPGTDCLIADFRIWSAARSIDEIGAWRFERVLPAGLPGLRLHYRFAEGGGSNLTDSASQDQTQDGWLAGPPERQRNERSREVYEYGTPKKLYPPAWHYDQPLTFVSVTASTGSVAAVSGEPGAYVYTPADNSNGPVSLQFTVTDGLTVARDEMLLSPWQRWWPGLGAWATNYSPVAGPATALEFNGSNCVVVSDAWGDAAVEEVTLEFWQKSAAPGGLAVQSETLAGTNWIGAVATNASGWIAWGFGNTNAGGFLAYKPPEPLEGWQHFALVSSKSGNYMKIYRNGVEEASKPGRSAYLQGSEKLILGTNFSGRLAGFRLWNTARSGQEIRRAMHACLTNNAPNLMIYYRFNAGHGTRVFDSARDPVSQRGAQTGTLVASASGSLPKWIASDDALEDLLAVELEAGTTNQLFLPAFDYEDGTNLLWASKVIMVPIMLAWGIQIIVPVYIPLPTGGLFTYESAVDDTGDITQTYWALDSAHARASGSIRLTVLPLTNAPPSISVMPNLAALEDTPLVQMPFTLSDDRPPGELLVDARVSANTALVQAWWVSGAGARRVLNVQPQPGETGTARLRLIVTDAGGKQADAECDLRLEPSPMFGVLGMPLLGGKAASFGLSVNDSLGAAGYQADLAGGQKPAGFFYRGPENLDWVDPLGPHGAGQPFWAMALNNAFMIACSGASNNGSTHVFRWTTNSDLARIGLPKNFTAAWAQAINPQGAIAGFGLTNGKNRALLFDADDTPCDLGTASAPYTDSSQAFGLNASTQAVGTAFASTGARRAVISFLDDQGVRRLRPLLATPNDTNSAAYAINSFGEVAGSACAFTAGDSALAFDGTDDWLECTNLLHNTNGASLAAANSDHAVEAWVMVNTTAASGPILRLGDDANGAHLWELDGKGHIVAKIKPGAGVQVTNIARAWTHLAAVYTAADSTLSVYVNGVLCGADSSTAANLQGIPLVLGKSANGFAGALDEVRVWKGARAGAQILAGFQQRLDGQETNLVVYLPFDQAAGAQTLSLASGHLQGWLKNGPVWSVRRGQPSPETVTTDGALALDGVSGYARTAEGGAPGVTNAMTIEAWVWPALRKAATLAGNCSTNGGSWLLSLNASGAAEFFVVSGSGASGRITNRVTGATSLPSNAWSHVAGVWDGASLRVYLDGRLDASAGASGPILGCDTPLALGGNDLFRPLFAGLIDEARLWTLARSRYEIATAMNSRLLGNEPGLAACYSFDEGAGTTAGNGVPGGAPVFLLNSATWAARDDSLPRAFLYETASGRLRSLGTVPGGGASEARAINDFGQAAGTALGSNGLTRAFFHGAGRLHDLNDLIPEEDQAWRLDAASGINRDGAVVGTGVTNGQTRAFLALPATVIGKPVIRPRDAVARLPAITLLRKHQPDDSPENAFFWSSPEQKLYAIRPVLARLDWFRSFADNPAALTNLMDPSNRLASYTINVWPKRPILHIAGAPVQAEPPAVAAHYTYQSLLFVTNAAFVEPSGKVFTCTNPGYTVLYYLNTEGLPPNPALQRPWFDVVRTVKWDDPARSGLATAAWTIGNELVHPDHADYGGRTGYVLFEKAPYDGAGEDRAYDRGTRLGAILPVNTERAGRSHEANPDPLVVVWYRTNRIGVAWASIPVQYQLAWPPANTPNRIVIASGLGSGLLNSADYPERRIYNQPDLTLCGFNPNEEHAYLPADTLFALRHDLNQAAHYSEPFVLLKYRDPTTARWQIKAFHVVAEEAPWFFRYSGSVGAEVQPPMPVSLMPLCGQLNRVLDGPGWKDYKGKVYAKAAGPQGTDAALSLQWFYPFQPGFFHPDTNVQSGDCIAWLDQRGPGQLAPPNDHAGQPGVPIIVTYDIRWGLHPVLQIGETLLGAKRGLPSVFDMAAAELIHDDLQPDNPAGSNSMVRFYDPVSPRRLAGGMTVGATLVPAIAIPPGITTRNLSDGAQEFPDLPWHLRLRLRHHPLNHWLAFSGYLDESFGVGEPLLLPNVLTQRERDDLRKLGKDLPASDKRAWDLLTGLLYDLTRNPGQVDLDPRDGRPDTALRLGLARQVITNDDSTLQTNVVAEPLLAGPKALTAALGGVPPAGCLPGMALSFDGTTGRVRVDTGSGDQSLDLAGASFTIEFWAKVSDPAREQYLLAQPGGPGTLGQLRLGFRAGGQFAFDLGTASPQGAFTTGSTHTNTDWRHWACVFDAGAFTQLIYRDGLLTATNILPGPYTGAGPIDLGGWGARPFHGLLDELRLWKTARSASEIRGAMHKRLIGAEAGLAVYFRFDQASREWIPNDSRNTPGAFAGKPSGAVDFTPSDAPAGTPPRFITLAENNDPSLPGGLPVQLHVIRVDDGPFRGDLKVLPGDNVFDERVTLRHSSDFGGDPAPLAFQWWYKPVGEGFSVTDLPAPDPGDSTGDSILDTRGWTLYQNYLPADGQGVNYITTGEGAESGLISMSDNLFICRYKGYAVNQTDTNTWSGWVGDPSGTDDQPRAALSEGWIKRVVRGLNLFDARTADFHSSAVSTYASMILEAGPRYEGPIAFNPDPAVLNKVGLIEAYQTVLERGKRLSIDGSPPVDFNPANNSLLLAATKIAGLYALLGNEAYADAQDPTIGFGTDSGQYGSLSSSIFAFQNQLDSLLEEEAALLRGRDDKNAGVAAAPVYNRLYWNFTLGDGEVAYQQVYSISDVAGDPATSGPDGFINEKDARVLYPQGHGDAWGHYLSALKQHYALLRHPSFTWIPRSELVNVAGVSVEVDFLDERQFARTAAAKAKTGREIVDLTYRLNYVDDPAGQWQGYKDTDPARAWGVTEWARRAAQGAYFDWLAANTLLPATDPNPLHQGIQKIDRFTVAELAELPLQAAQIQDYLDQADEGQNPLGLAKGVVLFDIDPAQVAAGQTHFEQIHARAAKTMNNALAVWDQANRATELLRRNQDTVEAFTANTAAQERDFKNRLLEIFGYPYEGDIGPGRAYPTGYDGPDLVHYMYVSTTDLNGETAPPSTHFTAFFKPLMDQFKEQGITFPDDTPLGVEGIPFAGSAIPVDFPVALASSYGFVAPAAWAARRAPGEVQLALSDLVQTQARLRRALQDYDTLIREINDRLYGLKGEFDLDQRSLAIMKSAQEKVQTMDQAILAAQLLQVVMERASSISEAATAITTESLPKVIGLANDVTAPVRGVARLVGFIAENGFDLIADGANITQSTLDLAKTFTENQAQLDMASAQLRYDAQQSLKDILQRLRLEAPLRLELFSQREVVLQSAGRYLAALAKGQRLVEERRVFRQRMAALTTEYRYNDMTFRIFRNDALQKYRAQFDLAARYVYLAATAYDYEVNLLGSDAPAGSPFLTDIIRQRSLGQMLNGLPVAGRYGLSDPLARLAQNFEVLKTELGFNNPQTESGRFSLARELFRAGAAQTQSTNALGVLSARAWTDLLQSCRSSNLWDLPEFRRYCRPFAPESAGPQPGLVIRFPTTVTFGLNFFGWPLSGGDSSYDPSRFATKVRSVGVWFDGYDGAGLSLTPRVYLVPAGMDVLRTASGNSLATREWRVVDQALPVPFPIGASTLSDPGWIPIRDSLAGSFADLRRHAGFRAYHDAGFDLSQMTTDSRLVGRSVWNTDWLLIIPGGTLLFDPDAGLDAFIQSVSDIKICFQTYSYPGN